MNNSKEEFKLKNVDNLKIVESDRTIHNKGTCKCTTACICCNYKPPLLKYENDCTTIVTPEENKEDECKIEVVEILLQDINTSFTFEGTCNTEEPLHCNPTISPKREYGTEIISVHEENNQIGLSDEFEQQCKYCEESFNDEHELNYHVALQHPARIYLTKIVVSKILYVLLEKNDFHAKTKKKTENVENHKFKNKNDDEDNYSPRSDESNEDESVSREYGTEIISVHEENNQIDLSDAFKQQCKYCEESFNDEHELNYHVALQHPARVYLTKMVVSKIYVCLEKNDFHAKTKKKTENVEKHKFKNKNDDEDNYSPRSDESNEDESVSRTSNALESSKLHCKFCDKKFYRRIYFDSHMLTQHRDKIATSDIKCKLHKCDLCPYESVRKSYVVQHREKHNNKSARTMRCHICKFTTISLALLRLHETQHNKLKCLFCVRTFRSRTFLEVHLLRDHRNKIEHDLPKYIKSYIYKCKDCSFICIRKPALDLHKNNKHEKYQNEKLVRYTCTECSYQTTQKNYLTFHQREHSNGFIACKFCPKTYKRKVHLDSHMLSAHKHEKNIEEYITNKIFSCDSCNYRTMVNYRLKRHVKSIHTKTCDDEVKISCDSCDYVTFNSKMFSTHLKSHSVDGKLTCKFCGEKFDKKRSLDFHLILKHKSQVRKMKGFITSKMHQCDSCTYVTVDARQLRTHVKKEHDK